MIASSMYSFAMYVLFFYVITLFTSQYCIHILVACTDHNSFDAPVLDVLYVGSFLLCYDFGLYC
jgi:hypothetical protein